MSKVHNVTYGKMLNESLFSSVDNFRTKIALCSLKMSMKSSRILKWKAGVKICFGRDEIILLIYVSFPVYQDNLDGHLPFDAYAILHQNSSKAQFRAKDEDMCNQRSYRCVWDCSVLAVEGSHIVQWKLTFIMSYNKFNSFNATNTFTVKNRVNR